MNKLLFCVIAVSISSFSCAGDDLSGHYYKKYQVPGRTETFSSEIKILRLSKNKAAVTVSITAPTAGSSCGGGIKGIANASKNLLSLIDVDEDEQCTVTIEVKDKQASVVSEEGCSGWHGAGCSLAESAVNVPWWRQANQSFKRDALKRAP